MKRQLAGLLTLAALLTLSLPALAADKLLTVDGQTYLNTSENQGTIHWYTPTPNPQSASYDGVEWEGNGSEHLPCTGLVHWVFTKQSRKVVISHCEQEQTTTTTTEDEPSITTTTTTVPSTSTTVPTTTSTTVGTTTTESTVPSSTTTTTAQTTTSTGPKISTPPTETTTIFAPSTQPPATPTTEPRLLPLTGLDTGLSAIIAIGLLIAGGVLIGGEQFQRRSGE